MNTIQSGILLQNLELHVHLGWPTEERQKKQSILLDIAIHFLTPPLACQTDQLADTVDYEQLSNQLIEKLGKKTFQLIEHLAHDAYSLIKKMTASHALVKVQVKKKPPILALKGGVNFWYGDTFPEF